MVLAGTAVGLASALGLAGCTAAPPDDAAGPRSATPPPPPAACLLDPAALAAASGVGWTPDQSTASDVRCVYDPDVPTGPRSAQFLVVELVPSGAGDPAADLDSAATACAAGSRVPLQAGASGFGCRFRTVEGVFAAVVRSGTLITVSSAAVPDGTTVERLSDAVRQQLSTLGR